MMANKEEALSSAAIEQVQQDAWRRTFDYVSHCSPFFREHFRSADISSSDRLTLEQLHRIPTIDKSVISEQPDAFLCVQRERIIDIVTTSGSTGQPLVWMLTEADLNRLAYNEYLSFRCVGLSALDTVILAVTLDRCFIAGMAYFLGLRQLGCSVVRIGPSTPAMHLDLIKRLKATAIVGVPSFLSRMADAADESVADLAHLGIKKAICIGEPIRGENLELSRVGEKIEREFGAKTYSTYGNTELASSLCECDAGQGGHLHPELLYLEVLDDAGNPVPEGHVGELTATTFGVEGMPLVRYRTGDFAAIFRSPCACGRKTPRIGPILGRKNQKLKLKGTTLFPSTLKLVLDSVPEISSYVIVARHDHLRSDSLEVKVACEKDSPALLQLLRERFQASAKVIPEITVTGAAEIESLQMPEGSRKRRYFVDLRN